MSLISSHILTELALVATKYGIISKGKLLKEITAEELTQECRPTLFINSPNRDGLISALNASLPPADFAVTGRGVRIFGEVNLNEILGKLISEGIEIESVNCYQSSIEDYYLSLVGGQHNA